MILLEDIIKWVRRIIKAPSEQAISDTTIIDYINRFYMYDVPARIQLFDLKRQYTFETIRGIDQYNFPYLEYNMIRPPIFCDGVMLGFFESTGQFYQGFPNLIYNVSPFTGDGTTGPYTTTLTQTPIIRGFEDVLGNNSPGVIITAINGAGSQEYIVDVPPVNNVGNGTLNLVDSTLQNVIAANVGTVDYDSGALEFQFGANIPATENINIQYFPYTPGVPRAVLFFNNIFKFRPVPDRSHQITVDCYITPSAFLTSASSFEFNWMAEYLARGAARKILSDNGDTEQLQIYEPFFQEQESFVIRRTNRQQMTQRTPTIFSTQTTAGNYTYQNY